VTAALVLSGCGSASDPVGKVIGATRKTAALAWVRYQIRFTESHLFPARVRVTGARGAYDFRTHLDYTFINAQTSGGGSENVFVDSSPNQIVIAPYPAPAGLLPAGKTWISAPLRGHQAAGTLVAQVAGLAPRLAIDEIRWGTRTASDLGTDAVGHVPMDEYRVSVDLRKAHSAAIRHGDATVVAAIEHELHSSPSGRVSIDVWVNGPGYISQIFERVPGSGLGGTSLSFTSYSEPYTGAFPPRAETVALASLHPGRRSVWALAAGS
jgi:hypothetical protein